MSKNQKGFSVSEGLLVFIVAGLLAGAGWYVWDKNKETDKPKMNSSPNIQKTETEQSEDKKMSILVSDNGVEVSYSSLPEGWTINTDCKDSSESNIAIVLPPTKKSIKCQSEEWGFAFFTINKNDSTTNTKALKDCSGENIKRNENKQHEWFVSYSCAETTVDGKKGTKEITVSNEMAPFTGGDTYIEYNFYVTNDVFITASFTNPTADNKPVYSTVFNNFVKSLEFQ